MKKIKFRAKDKEHGFYWYTNGHDKDLRFYCDQFPGEVRYFYDELLERPEQYIGFNDKNNVEIYENDRVKEIYEFCSEITETVGTIVYHEDTASFISISGGIGRVDVSMDLEVLKNN